MDVKKAANAAFLSVETGIGLLNRVVVLDIFVLTAEAAAYHHEEHRNEEDSQYGCGDHPAHYACTYGVLRTGTC
jgi:hypothetical protein